MNLQSSQSNTPVFRSYKLQQPGRARYAARLEKQRGTIFAVSALLFVLVGLPRPLWANALRSSHNAPSSQGSAGLAVAADQPSTPTEAAAVGFGRSKLNNVSITNPTSLEFGPDGRLYVSKQDGIIYAYTIARTSANSYTATMTETITLIQEIPNHNDDGALAPGLTTRQVTGILVRGTATNPVLYVSSSDPRTFVQDVPAAQSVDTNSGILSRLTWNGASWEKLDLVRGLPRSKENHSVNGMDLDESTNTLYLMVGGNTNMGAPSTSFAKLPEYALSAALLAIDLNTIGNTTYDLPTLDDEDRAGSNDANDPFGGNAGKNQAILDPTGPVRVYSPGYRNAYGVLFHSSGRLYTVDNGANESWGAPPQGCNNVIQDGGNNDDDVLQYITGEGYYGGHPNPTRGSLSNTFNTATPQSPVSVADPVECSYISSGNESGALATFTSSTNGITEYTASNFSGAMQGNLLTSSYNGTITRFQLNAAGNGLAKPKEEILGGYDNFTLDLTVQGDSELFPGTIWAATYYGGPIWVFEPNDYDGSANNCQGTDNGAIDEDGDGFSNADEIDNRTDPCSAGSLPFDQDGDLISDLNDPDDDNDGLTDEADLFALDDQNGMGTHLPLILSWDNGDPDPGGILSLGFTGLMNNGTNYASLYETNNIISGGAAGIVTLSNVPAGDAYAAANSQQFGFQIGLNVAKETTPFTIHTLLKTPFKGKTVADTTSAGIYFGTGDQDNYLKVVADANGGAGGIRVVLEQGGSVNTDRIYGPAQGINLLTADDVDLMLHINPVGKLATLSIKVDQGVEQWLGETIAVPAGWFASTSAPAVGIIATSSSATSFAASWDFLRVTATPASGPATVFLPFVSEAQSGSQTTTKQLQQSTATIPAIGPAALMVAPVANAGPDWMLVDADNDGIQAVKLNGGGSFDGDGSVISYTWSSDTGLDIPEGPYPTVELPVGIHLITLTVTDDSGETATDTVAITVLSVNESPYLYRVNAGGGIVTPTDGTRISWSADSYQSQSIYLVPTDIIRTYYTSATIDMSDPSIAGTSVTSDIFQAERYAITTNPGQMMEWNFPLSSTVEVEVRIYLAEIWFDEPGLRTFSVSVEGSIPSEFQDIKMFEAFGANKAAMLSHTLAVTDGNLDLDFIGVLENPAVKAIEIFSTNAPPPPPPDYQIYLPVVGT